MTKNDTKKKSSKQTRKIRQKIILEMLMEGQSKQNTINHLTAKGHDVSDKTFYRDMEAVRKQMDEDIMKNSSSMEKVLTDFMIKFNDNYRKAEDLHEQTEDDKVKARSIEIMHKMLHDKVRVLQSLGIMRTAPLQVEHTGGITVKKALELIKTVKVEYAESRTKKNSTDS